MIIIFQNVKDRLPANLSSLTPDCSSIAAAEKSSFPKDWLLHPTGLVFQFKANKKRINVDEDNFKFSYCCSSDTYNLNGKSVSGWQTFASNTLRFDRIEDKDQKIVFIAQPRESKTQESKLRENVDENPEIEWKFSLPNKPLKKLKVIQIFSFFNEIAT